MRLFFADIKDWIERGGNTRIHVFLFKSHQKLTPCEFYVFNVDSDLCFDYQPKENAKRFRVELLKPETISIAHEKQFIRLCPSK